MGGLPALDPSYSFTDGGEMDFRRKLEWVIQAPAATRLGMLARADRAGTVGTEWFLSYLFSSLLLDFNRLALKD